MPTNSEIDFPEVWDSTMRSAWVRCETYFKYGYLQHLRKPDSGVHLHFGACLAKGLEVTRKEFHASKAKEADAIAKGQYALIKDWADFPIDHEKKNLSNCLIAHQRYFEEYPLSQDVIQPYWVNDTPAIEMNFAAPIPGTKHPVTGEPIIYCGRFDMIGVFNEAPCGLDDKTASALGASWRSNWRLRSQFTGYTWGASQYGIHLSSFIIRGIGILKDKITFEQAIVSRPQWMIDRWLLALRDDIERATIAWRQGLFRLALDSPCAEFGGCPYLELCESPHPERWLDQYEVKKWEPLKVND